MLTPPPPLLAETVGTENHSRCSKESCTTVRKFDTSSRLSHKVYGGLHNISDIDVLKFHTFAFTPKSVENLEG